MNKLFTKIVGAALGATMAIGVGVAVGSNRDVAKTEAAETLAYTLTPANTTNNSYGGSGTATISGVEWNVEGNGQMQPWRLGGKSISSVDRRVYSSGEVSSKNISKVVLTVGSASSITVNSLSLKVGTSAGGSQTSTVPGTFVASSDITFNRPSGADWTSKYFTFTFNLTVSGKDNKFVQFTAAKFYYEASTKVTATYVSAYGTLSKSSEQVDSGSSITMPTISNKPSTHEFGGFSDGTNTFAEGATTTISANTTYTAQWTEIKELTSITLSGTYPTTFNNGDTFSHEGMVVTAHYGDSTSADVTSNAVWSGYDMSTSGSQTVTVSYTLGGITKTATYGITVNALPQYELITSAEGLETGAKYVIGNVNGTKFLSTTQNNNNRSAHTLSGTIVDNIVTYESGMEVIKLGGSTGAWTLEATAGTGSALGYLRAGSSSNNYLHTSESPSTWTITFSGSTPTLTSQYNNYTHNILKNNGDLFSCYASGQTAVALYKLLDTTESVAISKSSVSGLKTDGDTSVSITAKNFDPTNIEVSYSTSGVATVTKGTIENKVIPLNVAFDGVGDTTATISVFGGKATYTCTLDITVAQKPASLTLVNQYIDHGEIEVKHGGSRQISFTALDTDGEDYSINYSGITASSSNANVRLSGSTNMVLNGDNLGDAVVTCTITATAEWQTPITQTLTVHVIDDYNEKNVSISVINSVNVDQGEELVIADHISSRTATTHFGTNNNPIEDDELLFSYTNNRSAGVVASSFVWDVTDPDLPEGDSETRTVYVFVTFNESYAGTSFTAIVTVESRPVKGLIVDDVEKSNGDNIALSLSRNSTYDFNEHVTVNPANATESHEVLYAVTTGGDLASVSQGILTIGSKTGTVVVTVKPAAKQDFSITYTITITRETMKLTADLPASYVKVTSTVDLTSGKYLIVSEASNVVMKEAVNSTANKTTYENIDSSLDGYCFTYNASTGSLKGPNGSYIGKTASGNGMDVGSTEYTHTITFSDDNAVITASGGSILRYNTSWGGFRYYGSGQQAVQLYKQSGGETEVTVTDALFNVVNNAMNLKEGSSTLYDLGLCNASGTSFNTSAWNTLGSSFTDAIKNDNKLAYARADQNGNEIEQFLAVYDYVIGKKLAGNPLYSGANDFLGRVDSGKIKASTNINPLNVTANSNIVIAIIVVSAITLTSIGGYFFIRRRKHN